MNLTGLQAWQDQSLTESEFQALPKEDKDKYLHVVKQMTLRDRAYRILKYKPFPKQEQFHTSKASIRAIFGGNRSGKTTAGVIEFLMHMTGQYPDWYPEDMRFPKGKLVKGRIATVDFQKFVGGIIIPAIDEWIDSSVGGFFIQERKRNPNGVAVHYTFKNGNEFDILSYEQKTDQFEGWRGDIAWFDEPPPRDKYIATLRGLVDTKGRCWLTLTPLHQPWIYDQLYTVNDPKRIFVVTMGIAENPTLSQQYVNEVFAQAMDPAEREARLYGKFKHLSGLVYKEFNYDTHVVQMPKIQPHWIRYFAIDPHPRTPTACLWVAVDEKDQIYVYDELWLEELALPEMAMAIKAQEGTLLPMARYIDPAMDKNDMPAGGFNVRKELMKHGIYCSRANNNFDLGISKVRQALRSEYSNLLSKALPRLQISRECRHLVYEFQHYLWDDYTMRPEDHTAKQKAKKKNDHFLDCLRYIMNANPRFYRMQEEEEDVVYTGEYTKYPTKRTERVGSKSSYYDLVDRRID